MFCWQNSGKVFFKELLNREDMVLTCALADLQPSSVCRRRCAGLNNQGGLFKKESHSWRKPDRVRGCKISHKTCLFFYFLGIFCSRAARR